MTEINRRIRELTESRAAMERRLGELSEDNDRLRAAHARVFADHMDERDKRQRSDALLETADELIAAVIKHCNGRSRRIESEPILKRAVAWQGLRGK